MELKKVSTIRVRYAETDAMAIVWNGNYLSFFEIGRTELMRSFGLPYNEIERGGNQLPLTESYVKYIAPAFYDDELEIYAKLDWNGGARIKFEYEIHKDGSIITQGFTGHTFVNTITGRPVKPPEIFKEAFFNIAKSR